MTDELTGLFNRRRFGDAFRREWASARRYKTPLCLLMVDIDHFKSINDSHGHDAGDEVLREFASRVRALTRGIDVVARFGGEEIVVLMPDTQLEGVHAVAERIPERIATVRFPIHRGMRAVNVTVSIGVAARKVDDATADALLKRADLALYRAKGEGRDRVVAAAA